MASAEPAAYADYSTAIASAARASSTVHLPAGSCHMSSPNSTWDLMPSNGSLLLRLTTTMMHTGSQATHALRPTRVAQRSHRLLFCHCRRRMHCSTTIQTGRFQVASCKLLPPTNTSNYASTAPLNAVEVPSATANASSEKTP